MTLPRPGMHTSASRALAGTLIASSRVRRDIFAFLGLGATPPMQRPLWTSRVGWVGTLVYRLFPSIASNHSLILGYALARRVAPWDRQMVLFGNGLAGT